MIKDKDVKSAEDQLIAITKSLALHRYDTVVSSLQVIMSKLSKKNQKDLQLFKESILEACHSLRVEAENQCRKRFK